MNSLLSYGPLITALVAIVCAVATLLGWMMRRLVREELESIRQDVAVLRMAVFNHLAHGELVSENEVRARIGFSPRTN